MRMTPTRARLILALSIAGLVVVVAAWLAWPDAEGRADLEAVKPIVTTTTSMPTTTPAPTPTTTVPAPLPLTDPTRVRVPSIGLDAPVVPVGLRSDGQMEVPAASDVGWYRLGPAPGDTGSAVLAAHVDYGGQRGAFFDLRSVPVGAEVFVDGDGTTRRFVVSLREQLPKDAVALERYFTAEGPERLTLITCGGAFDRGAGHYVDNIILTADLAT
jgi:sortase (surface protein transpeptidase)